ncbi:MAG TPA: NAD(P)/FAD-dependent oxidoreductase [Gemmatimonadaceae bacterium]
MPRYDAVVVGSGPNGLTAAVVLARAGLSVLVIEAAPTIGGGTRTQALTLPGFAHDVCSCVHPMAAASPILSALPLATFGLELIEPPIALAHPFDDRPPALLRHDLASTARAFGRDADAYESLIAPIASRWNDLAVDLLAPLHWPAHPLSFVRFGLHGLQSATSFVRRFTTPAPRALFAGMAAHAMQPLTRPGTAAFGLILAAIAHRVGWPFARGGSHAVSDALAAHLRELGSEIVVGRRVASLGDIPPARATLLDVTPRQLLRIAGDAFARRYALALRRFRYGPGVFKVDWALSRPVPWRSAECAEAGTLHLAGDVKAVEHNEQLVANGEHPERPTVLVAQPSAFDPMRAPAGCATLWTYCHVPHGSTVDMLPAIEAQLERFAPGFRDCVLAQHTMNTAQLEAHNANMVGGDIGQGANTLRQLFLRPVASWNPYATAVRGLYLCSSSTPPGGGVHGMCGYHAARAALRDMFGMRVEDVIPLAPH